ncbi:hypothetical protein IMCC3317_44960 [Kordia antarctica]|uniref:TIR domain-containing protein n=1 Tax=Kordia antarctica TaxID=1218801 RepID=A0A7L4ZR13_9FLAO|nr:hypothetical protein [Kordia antarctica]QHI39095.1 hypothetical protein IMCC3317_44960 [Kordia antarctica]
MVGGKKNKMDTFTKGTANIVEINPNSFISAIELAEKANSLVTENSSDWINYLRKLKIDLELISEFCGNIMPRPERKLINDIYTSFIPKLVIIKKGLMSGFFIYDTDIKKAYFYYQNPKNIKVKPLKKYSLCDSIPEYDFVISYSNKDVSFTRDLFQMFSFNFKLYFLDIEKVVEDPLWQIRYREAMYHSQYFIPVFSENYLTTQGALSEFFESVYLNIDFRTITFYNYFIPFIIGDLTFEGLKNHVENNKDEYAQYFNYDIKIFFEILNDINFGLRTEIHTHKEIVLFLKSIVTNNKNNLQHLYNNTKKTELDINFIELLLKETEYVIYSKLSDPALKIVTLFTHKSFKKWNIIDILSDGRCINRQFTTEIQDDAIKVNENIFKDISNFLNEDAT